MLAKKAFSYPTDYSLFDVMYRLEKSKISSPSQTMLINMEHALPDIFR